MTTEMKCTVNTVLSIPEIVQEKSSRWHKEAMVVCFIFIYLFFFAVLLLPFISYFKPEVLSAGS